MSWDLQGYRFPPEITDLSELPDGWEPVPVDAGALRAAVLALFPDSTIEADGWTNLRGPGFGWDASFGEAEYAVHVRELSDEGLRALTRLAAELEAHFGFRAIDMQTGNWFDEDAARASFAKWADFRNRTLGEGPPA